MIFYKIYDVYVNWLLDLPQMWWTLALILIPILLIAFGRTTVGGLLFIPFALIPAYLFFRFLFWLGESFAFATALAWIGVIAVDVCIAWSIGTFVWHGFIKKDWY